MAYFVHESSVIDDNVKIGDNTKIWHFSHVSSGAEIGSNSSLGQNTYIGVNVHIGNNVKIQNNVSVYSGVNIHDKVFCGPSVVFTNDLNPRAPYSKGGKYISTTVKEGASLGANATIVCGNTIGKWAFVAAGSVVTSNVKDYSMVMGVPAIHYAWICECGEKLEKDLCCKCGRKYKKTDTGLEEIK